MDPNVREWLELVFRWAHVVTGITWIGHLYFFNWVNAQLAKTYDADSKKKVVPELMPRALYFFRWGAAYTWVTGVLLLWLVYWEVPSLLVQAGVTLGLGASIAISIGVPIVAFAVYDILWSSPLGKNEQTAVIVSLVLLTAVAFGLS